MDRSHVLARARRGHAGLFWFGVSMAGSAVVLVVAAVVDQRTLLGQPLWFKPLKFALSFTLYASTLAWMVSLLPRRSRLVSAAGWSVVTAGVVEMVIIIGQAARGRTSHFNVATPQDATLYSVMGATVAALWLATAVIAVLVIRARGVDAAATSAVRAGLVLGLVGAGLGIALVVNGGHSVGVPDGGPGLALVGWSTTGGDLRVGHFVGMHALQLLPLLAAALAALAGDRLDVHARRDLIRIAAVGYAGLLALLTWQAYRGQPLLEPDAPTATALLVILAAVVIGVAVVAAGARGDPPAEDRSRPTPTARTDA